jgi:hypothetical protein
MSSEARAGRFSARQLLTPKDKEAFDKRYKKSPAATGPFRLMTSRIGWKYLGRVMLSAVGWVLAEPIKWAGRRIQAARSPLSPFLWLKYVTRVIYKLVRRGKPLTEAQEARRKQAAETLHPRARQLVLDIEMFQAKLPHNFGGQYTAFGGVALKAGNDQPSLDLIRHEWAHYWWNHQMTGDERAAFMRRVKALADGPDVPDEMQYAQELARAYYEGRDAICLDGGRRVRIATQSNDGYRIAYCFNLVDLEVHAYIAQLSHADLSRVPALLRPFYVGFFAA